LTSSERRQHNNITEFENSLKEFRDTSRYNSRLETECSEVSLIFPDATKFLFQRRGVEN